MFSIVLLAIVLVPAAFVPTAERAGYLTTFYSPKFEVLRVLSVLLLGAVVLDKDPRLVPVLIPALAFLAVSALSALLSGDVLNSLIGDRYDGLLSLTAGVLLFYATARFLDSWSRVRTLLAAGVATAVLISVYGILQNFGLDPVSGWMADWPERGRAFSTVGHPVHLAAYLTLMMGATLALYFLTRGRFARGLLLAALALVGACWLYTYTRGAVLGVGVALPVVLWLAHRRVGSIKPLLLPLAVLAVAMLAAQLSSPRSADVIDISLSANLAQATTPAEQPPSEEQSSTPRESSITTRLLVWRDTIPMILDRPLLGHGPDNFRLPFERYQGEDLQSHLSNNKEYIDKAHNEFLQVAATTGLLGLAAYLWVLVAYFRNAYQRGGWVLLALCGGVLAYILQLQTAFTTIANGVAFWAVLGISVAVMRVQDRENEPGEEERSDSPGAAARGDGGGGAGQDHEV